MSRYRFELATEADDADLRDVLAATPMSGRIAVAFRREPSYFAASVVEGDSRQIVAARDQVTGRIVGFGCRSLRSVFVNDRMERIGYLSALRLLAEHRRRGLVAKGFAHFRKLHADGAAKYYLTTIAEGNQLARRTLLGARAGLPRYHDLGRYLTAVLVPKPRRTTPPCDVRPATNDMLADLVAFWRQHGPRRQYFPRYVIEDFRDDGMLRGLRPEDIYVARVDGAIVGTLALWDQRAFRQSMVVGYDGVARRLRRWYNLWAAVRGSPQLPQPGTMFNHVFAALNVVADDRVDAFSALLNETLAQAAERGGASLLVGMHESDPLLGVLRGFRPHWYATRLYAVCWEDGEPALAALDSRPPYLELGSL